jgi:sterol desaturase/sphingolipid hydroxylase (fatty acid hydroxylase superfamily)
MIKNGKKTDKFVIFIRFMDIITWTLIFIAMLFFEKARPQTETIFDIRYSKGIRNTWNIPMAEISLWVFVVAAVLSIVGLLINLGFLGDKKHHMSYGLLLGLILSLSASSAFILLLL